MTEKCLRVIHHALHIAAANSTSSTSLDAEEAVEHVLNIIEMLFSDLPARLEVITEDCRAGSLETVGHLAAALGKLCHDLLVQPDVHFRRAIERACVAEFLRQLLPGTKSAVQFQLHLARRRVSQGLLRRQLWRSVFPPPKERTSQGMVSHPPP